MVCWKRILSIYNTIFPWFSQSSQFKKWNLYKSLSIRILNQLERERERERDEVAVKVAYWESRFQTGLFLRRKHSEVFVGISMCCRCQGHSFSNHLWTNVFLCLLSSRYSECLCYLYKTKWRQVVYLWKPIQIFSGMCGVKSMHYPSWIYLVTNWYICLFQTVLTFTW